jgi:hypothetical protein
MTDTLMTTVAPLQARVDDAFATWGRSAPSMRAGEGNREYIERISRIAQKKHYLAYDEPCKKIDFSELPDGDAFRYFTDDLLAGIRRSVARPDTVNPAERERKVIMKEPNTGQSITGWVRAGNRPFTDDLKTPCRRAVIVRPATMALLGADRAGMAGLF